MWINASKRRIHLLSKRTITHATYVIERKDIVSRARGELLPAAFKDQEKVECNSSTEKNI